MQCLKELAVQEYDSLPFYFNEVTALVGRAMVDENINEKVQAQAFEFWTMLTEEEIERSLSHTKECRGFI